MRKMMLGIYLLLAGILCTLIHMAFDVVLVFLIGILCAVVSVYSFIDGYFTNGPAARVEEDDVPKGQMTYRPEDK